MFPNIFLLLAILLIITTCFKEGIEVDNKNDTDNDNDNNQNGFDENGEVVNTTPVLVETPVETIDDNRRIECRKISNL